MYLKSNGWKALSVVQLCNVIEAYRCKHISYKAFRVYFYLAEAVARQEAETRCKRVRRRQGGGGFKEEGDIFVPLTYRRSVRHLEKAGLISRDTGITLAEYALPFAEDAIQAAVGRGRSTKRLVPVPREVLRFIQKCSRPAVSLTMLAYCIRGLSIRAGEVKNTGSVKATWIANTFGVSLRSVRAARSKLVELGWIGRDQGSHQRKLNRTGAYFEVDLSWAHQPAVENRVGEGSESSPPTSQKRTESAPPIERLDNSGNTSEGTSGVSIKNIAAENLHRLSHVETLYQQAIRLGFLRHSESTALNFLAAAVRARECARPGAVFMGIIKRRLWHHITQTQEDLALAALSRGRQVEPAFMTLPVKHGAELCP